MLKTLTVAICLASPLAYAEKCSWMPDSRINEAYPDRAPWSTLAGGQGRCKFVSDQRKASSTLSLTQMVNATAKEAEAYVVTLAKEMAETYQVKPVNAIGKAGVAVRENGAPNNRMLTLIGHQKNIVVMTQLSFHGGVNEAQQAKAQELTTQTFVIDTGGGLRMP